MRRVPAYITFVFALSVAATALASDGASLFVQNCALCHQSDASGLAGEFPRLAGRIRVIGSKPAGRSYLIHVLSYGLSGRITVDAQPIVGVMPSFGQLGDDDVANLLTYLQGLGDTPAKVPRAITQDEVAAARANAHMSGADVLAERQTLVGAKVIP